MAHRHYESYIIIDGNLEEAQIEDVISKFEKFLSSHETIDNKTEKIGRRRLAYPIKKRQNGYYVCFYFNAENDLVAELERNYRLDENILRFLTIFLDEKTIKERDEHFVFKAAEKEAMDIAEAEAEAKEKELSSEDLTDTDVPVEEEKTDEVKTETTEEVKSETTT